MTDPKPGSDDAARLAFSEIDDIMKKRGVCGFALFQSHNRCYLLRNFPDWQALWFMDDEVGRGIGVKLKREEEPDQITYNNKASRTAAVIDAMFQILGNEALAYGKLREKIDKAWPVDWQPLSDYDPEHDH